VKIQGFFVELVLMRPDGRREIRRSRKLTVELRSATSQTSLPNPVFCLKDSHRRESVSGLGSQVQILRPSLMYQP
jgi:hypothetical protein